MGIQELVNFNIKRLRKKAGITQEELAEKIGLTPQGVSNLERNKYMANAETLDKICEVLNITPDVLCRKSISKSSKSDLLLHINSDLEKLSPDQLKQILKIIETFTE